jgi:hypothetical protein
LPLHRPGEALEPGAAVAAVLVEHLWARTLDEAVSRTGGKPLPVILAAVLGAVAGPAFGWLERHRVPSAMGWHRAGSRRP